MAENRLFRVEVGDVSVRYVEASTPRAATASVSRDLLAAFDLRADRADPHLAITYFSLGRLQRNRLIAALDGLNTSNSTLKAQRELAKLQEWERRSTAHVAAAMASAPPITPERIERLLRLIEVDRTQRNRMLRRYLTDHGNEAVEP